MFAFCCFKRNLFAFSYQNVISKTQTLIPVGFGCVRVMNYNYNIMYNYFSLLLDPVVGIGAFAVCKHCIRLRWVLPLKQIK